MKYNLIIFLSILIKVLPCQVASGIENISSTNIDTRFKYNWYYGTIGGKTPGVLLVRIESLNCSSNYGIVYGSLIWFNSTTGNYNRISSLSLPKNMRYKPLLWQKWGMIHNNNGVTIKTPRGNLYINTNRLYSQGTNQDGFVKSGLGNNTAYSFSYPLATYSGFFTNNTDGYFEHVKTSFLDTGGSMSWICIYLFQKRYSGFLCGEVTGINNPYAHGMLVDKKTNQSLWLPQWAFTIKNPNCFVKSSIANTTFPNCFSVKTPFIEFETSPIIEGDLGSITANKKIKSWVGTTQAITKSGTTFSTITEIVLATY